jgi:hypothetical protein
MSGSPPSLSDILQMRFGEEKVALVPTMHLSRSEISSPGTPFAEPQNALPTDKFRHGPKNDPIWVMPWVAFPGTLKT